MISIIIPTYEMKGMGTSFLRRALDSINKQVLDPIHSIEVIVSDHSKNDQIARFIKTYASRFPIRHCLNSTGHGNISQNTNFGITQAQFPYAKILFQDSFLLETNYLNTVAEIITNHSPDYIFTSAAHLNNSIEISNEIHPHNNEFLLFGQNTASEPSTLTLKTKLAQQILFDENLKLLMDCDFYYRLFSEPSLRGFFENSIHAVIGVWSGQTQNELNGYTVISELKHLLKKYPNDYLEEKLLSYCEFLKDKDLQLSKMIQEKLLGVPIAPDQSRSLFQRILGH